MPSPMHPDSEYHTAELPAIRTLQKLGWQFLDSSKLAAERPDNTQVILADRLRAAIQRLNPTLDAANQVRAFDRLTGVVGASLLDINESIWKLLRGGSDSLSLKQETNGKAEFPPVHFLDYHQPANNDWLVVSQARFHGKAQNSVPDLVLLVNGLPLAVIECKAASAASAADTAWKDLTFYQGNTERLFHYNQICAGLWGVGACYGAIGAPQSAYAAYNDEKADAQVAARLDLTQGTIPTPQERLLVHLFEPARLLDLVRHFVLFEREVGGTVTKKLPRYQQVRATNRTIAKLREHQQGGVIWHTQGSGKSLTMAYLIRKLQAPESGFDNPTILVLTDRKDLDDQITNTLRAAGLPRVLPALSVRHLADLLRNDYGSIITSTLHKFEQPDTDAAGTLEAEVDETEATGTTRIDRQIMDALLVTVHKALRDGRWVETDRQETPIEVLSTKANLFVLVDEAHRSHYGFLAAFMRTALPNAKFVAFTGTPIATADKSTLAEFYGHDYLDVYTLKESVADGATVELLYDAGVARLDVRKAELDAAFTAEFGHESEEKQAKLKEEALRKYQLSQERITEICKHLLGHYQAKIRPEGHKALLVCAGRPAALLYKQTLDALADEGWHNLTTRVVVSLGTPKSDPLAADHYARLEWNRTHPHEAPQPLLLTSPEHVKAVTEDFKLPFGDESDIAKSGRKKHDNTAILIVSDMLLTGYDAPLAACLYLDKPLRAHNLLQALARVNRTGPRKVAGYIVDYVGITEDLLAALDIYSGDVALPDLLRDRNEEIPHLELHHAQLVEFLAKSSRHDRHYARAAYIDAAVRFIEPLSRRDTFKTLLKAFNKSVSLVLPHPAALKYERDFLLFNEIKLRARNAFVDDEELKISPDESQRLQALIDAHLTSSGVQNLLAEPVSIIDRDRFRAELADATPATRELKMRHSLTHVIKVGLDRNPDFFRPLAERLEALLREHEAGRLAQVQLLLEYDKLQDALAEESREANTHGFTTQRQVDVFNSLMTIWDSAMAADVTAVLFEAISGELSIVGWTEKGEVAKEIENKLYRLLKAAQLEDARKKAQDLVNLLRKNTDA